MSTKKRWMGIVLVLILVLSIVMAYAENESGEAPEPVEQYYLECEDYPFHEKISCYLGVMITKSAMSFINFFDRIFVEALNPNLTEITVKNAEGKDVSLLYKYWQIVYIITQSLVGLALLVTAGMWMTSRGIPEKVERAKSQMLNFLFMSIFMAASWLVIQELINISRAVTDALYFLLIKEGILLVGAEGALVGILTAVIIAAAISLGVAAAPLLLAVLPPLAIFALGFFIAMGARLLVVAGLVVLSPFLIFLYFLLPTREWGEIGVRLLLVQLFVPIIWTVTLGVAVNFPPPLSIIVVFAALPLNMWLYGKLTGLGFTGFGAARTTANLVGKATEIVKYIPK